MKKNMAILLALVMAVSYCPTGNAAEAEQAGDKAIHITDTAGINAADGTTADKNTESKKEETTYEEKTGSLPEQSPTTPEGELPDTGTDENAPEGNHADIETDGNISEISGSGELEGTGQEKGKKENKEKEKAGSPEEGQAGMKGLQIPQKLEVVIDQWGLDGKTQVYSDKYIIENTGDVAGTLTLSGLAYKPQKGSGVSIRTDKKGLHDGSGKSIYMEMAFQKGKDKKETIVLSQQEAEYEARLEPGEGLSIRFTGEVNEYAAEPWEHNDIVVTAVYSWEEEMPDGNDIAAEEEETPENDRDVESFGIDVEETGDTGKTEDPESTESSTQSTSVTDSPETAGTEEPLQEGGEDPGNGEGEEDNTEDAPDSQAQEENSGSQESQEGQIENIDLQLPEEWDMKVDSWTEGGEGKFLSKQYVIRNTGETTGVLTLAGLACSLLEKGGEDSAGTDTAHIDMEAGNGDRVTLSGEPSEYKAELKPGEGLSICFEWKPDGKLPGDWENSSPAVTATASWDIPGSGKE